MIIENKIREILEELATTPLVRYVGLDQGQADVEEGVAPHIQTPGILVNVQGVAPIVFDKYQTKNKLTIDLRLFVETPLSANTNAPQARTEEYLKRFNIIEYVEKKMSLIYAELEGWNFVAQRKSMTEYCIKLAFTGWD